MHSFMQAQQKNLMILFPMTLHVYVSMIIMYVCVCKLFQGKHVKLSILAIWKANFLIKLGSQYDTSVWHIATWCNAQMQG